MTATATTAQIPAERTRPGKAFQVVNIFEIGTGRFVRQVRHYGTTEQARAYGLMGQLHDSDPLWHELRAIVAGK